MTVSSDLEAIHTLAEAYAISRANAARVYAGELNASVERGCFEGLPDGVTNNPRH